MILPLIVAMVFASDHQIQDHEEKEGFIMRFFEQFDHQYGKITGWPSMIENHFQYQALPKSGFKLLHLAVILHLPKVTKFVCDKLKEEGREDLLEAKNESIAGSSPLTVAAMQYNASLNNQNNPFAAGKFLEIVKILISAKCSFVTTNEMGNCALDFLRYVREKILFDEFQSVYQQQGITSTGLNLESYLLRNIAASYVSRQRLQLWISMPEGREKDMYDERRMSFWNTRKLYWQNTIKNPLAELTREYLKNLVLYLNRGYKYTPMILDDKVHDESVLMKENEKIKEKMIEEYKKNSGDEGNNN